MEFLKKITNIGLSPNMSGIDRRRVVFTNHLICSSIGILLLLLIANTITGTYTGAIIDVIVALVFASLLWLNHKKQHLLVSLLYLNLTVAAVYIATQLAFKENRFSETENFLYAFLSVAVFLLDRWKMLLQSLFLVAALIVIKTDKFVVMNAPLDINYTMTIVNVVAL